MQKKYVLKMPGAVYSGENALDSMGEILKDWGTKAAVFTDRGIRESGLLSPVFAQLEKLSGEYVIFDELAAEPTCDQAQDAVDAFKKSGAEFIVAVGGGSVMDTAKLASVLATDDYSVRDLLDHPYMGKMCVKSLMIPTTAGTGAEATPNAIVAVPEKELKVGIVNDAMIADGVILDARMIKSLPGSITAATGVDALCHAIECFTSKKRNPFRVILIRRFA